MTGKWIYLENMFIPFTFIRFSLCGKEKERRKEKVKEQASERKKE